MGSSYSTGITTEYNTLASKLKYLFEARMDLINNINSIYGSKLLTEKSSLETIVNALDKLKGWKNITPDVRDVGVSGGSTGLYIIRPSSDSWWWNIKYAKVGTSQSTCNSTYIKSFKINEANISDYQLSCSFNTAYFTWVIGNVTDECLNNVSITRSSRDSYDISGSPSIIEKRIFKVNNQSYLFVKARVSKNDINESIINGPTYNIGAKLTVIRPKTSTSDETRVTHSVYLNFRSTDFK